MNRTADQSPLPVSWKVFGLALGSSSLALGLLLIPGPESVTIRSLLVAISSVMAGVFLLRTLQVLPSQAGARQTTAGLVALAALPPLLGGWALEDSWDTALLVTRMFVALILLAAVMVLLPVEARKAVASVLIVVHLGGLFTAIQFAPVNGEAPWLVSQIWHRMYRPYLQFLNMGCSYRFFAPEPGGSAELWVRLQTDEGRGTWLTFPRRDDYATPLEYHRGQKIVESINNLYHEPVAGYVGLETLAQRRVEAGLKHEPPIPVATLEPSYQYRELIPRARILLESLARHAVRTKESPGKTVTGLKVYRAAHQLLTPRQLLEGYNPRDLTTYHAYFLGDFQPDGRLSRRCSRLEIDPDNQNLRIIQDPFLYWMIPIIHEPADEAPDRHPGPPSGPIRNYVLSHAGDSRP